MIGKLSAIKDLRLRNENVRGGRNLRKSYLPLSSVTVVDKRGFALIGACIGATILRDSVTRHYVT